MIWGVVLAAGSSRRFGAVKQIADLEGKPLLEHALLAAARAPSLERVVVVLGANASEIRTHVHLHGADVVHSPMWQEGLSASLRAGVGALADQASTIVVTLGDQPRVVPEAIERVLAARDDRFHALRASYGGLPGHPVVLERAIFGEIHGLRGDTGARELLDDDTLKVPCDGLGSPLSIDTQEQLELANSA